MLTTLFVPRHLRVYEDGLRHILDHGTLRAGRNGDTVRKTGYMMEFDLTKGFPLVTTKKVFWKGVLYELLWFISGDTNVGYLQENGVHIWDEWADEYGDLGPVYGKQWRDWNGHDQLLRAIRTIKEDPYSRRNIVSAWNVDKIDGMALPPCHLLYQFHCDQNYVSLTMYQRSADAFLGVPFNIASYAALLEMVAYLTGRMAKDLVLFFADFHIYCNHLEQVKLQLSRRPRNYPKLEIVRPGVGSIDDFRYEDFRLLNYNPHPAIKGEVSP